MTLLPNSLGRRRGLAVVTLLATVTVAHAQGGPGRADPLDAQARVPAATHVSPLAGYRRLGDDERTPWQDANQRVNRVGGWRAYAREAQQPEPASSAPPGRGLPAPAPGTVPASTSAPTPTPAPAHGGHRTP